MSKAIPGLMDILMSELFSEIPKYKNPFIRGASEVLEFRLVNVPDRCECSLKVPRSFPVKLFAKAPLNHFLSCPEAAGNSPNRQQQHFLR